MFSSRPSDPRTVLLWGDRWWVAGHGVAGTFAEPAQAAGVLAEHFREEPKPVRIRLVYQPDSFTSAAVPCPPGNRATLAAALGGEFPALARRDLAWSHDPVLAKDGAYSTVLHFEAEPQLLALAGELARMGIAIESAWPLAAYLPALLSEWTESGAFTVVVVEANRACGYRRSAEGLRSVQHWLGASTLADTGQWLGEILGEDAKEPVMAVFADEVARENLQTFIAPERPGMEMILLGEILGRCSLLPRYHTAQLLPKPPAFSAQRAVIAASVVCLLAASWIGATFARDTFAARVANENRHKAMAGLRQEIAHLHTNQAEIAELRGLIERGAAGPPCSALLARLGVGVPTELVLSSVRIHAGGFELAGWTAPSTPPGMIEAWRRELAPDTAGWTATVQPKTGGAFTVTGRFRL